MDLKEMVERINGARTMLVKVNISHINPHDIVVAGPATYHEEGYATLYRYSGPRDWNAWLETIEEPKMEMVEEKNITGPIPGLTETGTIVNGVTPYETDLDTMPLRDLPLWAKELWVTQTEYRLREQQTVDRHAYDKVRAMKKLIEQEKRGGGLDPDKMNADMKERYLKLWYSMQALSTESMKKLDEDALWSMRKHLETLSVILPNISELPWRNEGNLDPESWFNREDVYEGLTQIMHGAIGSLMDLTFNLIHEKQMEEYKDG